jgi:DDE domain
MWTKSSSGPRACSTLYGAPWTRVALYSISSCFFRQLLKGLSYMPREIVTDKLKNYDAAKRKVLPDVERRQSRCLNNRAENSDWPPRRRERQMHRFKSPQLAQLLLSAHSFVSMHFHPRRHFIAADCYREIRARALGVGRRETCARMAARYYERDRTPQSIARNRVNMTIPSRHSSVRGTSATQARERRNLPRPEAGGRKRWLTTSRARD